MIAYTKNRQTEAYDIIGPAEMLIAGTEVTVTTKSGQTRKVTVGKVSKPFEARFGPHLGKPVAIATVVSSSHGRDYPGKNCPCCGSEDLDNNLSCWECGYMGS